MPGWLNRRPATPVIPGRPPPTSTAIVEIIVMAVKRIRILASILAAAAAAAMPLLAASGASASSAAVPGVPLQNTGDGLCLQPADISMGASIIQEPCTGTAIQAWDYLHTGGTSYEFYNIGTGLCMYAGNGTRNGAPVIQWSCSSVANENWDTLHGLPDITSLVTEASGAHSHCLDVPGAQSTIGLEVQTYQCNGTGAQGWMIGIGVITQ